MGAKLGCVVLIGAYQPDAIFVALRPVLEQWQPRTVDCFVSRPTDVESLASVVTIVAVRSDPLPPGNSEVAEVLSSEFQARALAVAVNDFFQSSGFQLWDRGRPRSGLHVEHEIELAGLNVDYLAVPAIGLSLLLGREVASTPTLLEDLLAQTQTGVDRRLVRENEILDPAIDPPDPIDWSWNTVHLMWPAGEVLARVKLYQSTTPE